MGKIKSVLFTCDHNAVRSPMAEGIMKDYYGKEIYVQSAGAIRDQEIDGFAIAVCDEIGVALEKHKTRSFDDMRDWGDPIDSYDLIIAMSRVSYDIARSETKGFDIQVEFWPTEDPSATGETREDKLAAYRAIRDQISERIIARFGTPTKNP